MKSMSIEQILSFLVMFHVVLHDTPRVAVHHEPGADPLKVEGSIMTFIGEDDVMIDSFECDVVLLEVVEAVLLVEKLLLFHRVGEVAASALLV